jgi:hypothetical protein
VGRSLGCVPRRRGGKQGGKNGNEAARVSGGEERREEKDLGWLKAGLHFLFEEKSFLKSLEEHSHVLTFWAAGWRDGNGGGQEGSEGRGEGRIHQGKIG